MLALTNISSYLLCGAAFALAASLFWFLFLSTSKTPAVPPVAIKRSKLPQGWWTDAERFKTERRAIFSQTWICVSHRSRFVKAGDYIAFDIAGFRVLLMLAKKASGSATVLGCRYHGWSYDTKGQLTKAPHFDNVPGFEKSHNGLFPIHTREDEGGFLHINMSGSQVAGVGMVNDAKTTKLASSQASHFLDTWEVKGSFNWKVTASDTQQTFQTPATDGTPHLFSAKHNMPTSEHCLGLLTFVLSKPGSPLWCQVTYSPDSVEKTTVRCDVYSTQKLDTRAFDSTAKDGIKTQIQAMVHQHEGIYAKLTDPNSHANCGGYDQSKIADMVDAHLEKEKIQGQEIQPAAVQQCRSAAYMQAEGSKDSPFHIDDVPF
ncbi:hypothetical protein ACHAPT_005735 [Fusarium lateritium]